MAFRGVEPIGAVIEFEVMDILRIENGQIAEHWGIAESHRLLRQLGVR
jgi:predicted ester cyclase